MSGGGAVSVRVGGASAGGVGIGVRGLVLVVVVAELLFVVVVADGGRVARGREGFVRSCTDARG